MLKRISLVCLIIVLGTSAFASAFCSVNETFGIQKVNVSSESELKTTAGATVRLGIKKDNKITYIAGDCDFAQTFASYSRFCEIPTELDYSVRIGRGKTIKNTIIMGEAGVRVLKPYLFIEADAVLGFKVASYINVTFPFKVCFNSSGKALGCGISVGVGL